MIDAHAVLQLTREERAALRQALDALDPPDADTTPDVAGGIENTRPTQARRRGFATLMTVASLALIPWIVVLGVRLPHRYIAGHWTLTWVGFDVLLLISLAATSWLAWKGRQLVILASFATATLLVCDAWFDVTTASGHADVVVASLTAALLELPLAILLFTVSAHLLLVVARRHVSPPRSLGSLARAPLAQRHDASPAQEHDAPPAFGAT